ncbi:hypothetical protein J6590_081571 [Homalodisca vitripennis]|nr:hypothetical protein J6590_081571 [Homalodisca vitripennis]
MYKIYLFFRNLPSYSIARQQYSPYPQTEKMTALEPYSAARRCRNYCRLDGASSFNRVNKGRDYPTSHLNRIGVYPPEDEPTTPAFVSSTCSQPIYGGWHRK